MKTPKIIAALALFVAVPAFAAAPAQPYRFAPAAGWVNLAPVPPLDAAPVEQGQADYLLIDHQVRLAKLTTHYRRFVERLVSQSSVDESAQISIEIDPVHERVLLHEVRVFRAGRVLDKLADSRRSLLNRESELEDGLINGLVTLHVLLQDVRVGDVLDYSYTVERTDPISERGYNQWFSTQWSSPVRHFRLRMLRPADRQLQIRDHGKLAPPSESRRGEWLDTTWEARDIAGLQNEDGKPAWFFLYPRIEFSEFADWQAVRNWAQPMYVAGPENEPALAAQLAELKSEPDEALRILKALRFVQDDVRYTGLEIGAGAYRPTQPATVLGRRFGDCKDKVLLLVTLLRALGVEAAPALVHSRIGRGTMERLPSPGAFDHVIAKVRWRERDYWLDATASGQGGDLDTLVQADFGVALVLAPGASGLETIPARDGKVPLQHVVETYDFRKGTSQQATFRVVAYYRGEQADSMRDTMLTNTATKLGKEYLDYYRKMYPDIRMVKPLAVQDDRARNQLTTEETYEIDTPFAANEQGKRKFAMEAYLISERTGKPKLIERTTPLARRLPMHVQHQIVAYLPGEWNIKSDRMRVRNEAFQYSSSVRYHNGTLELNYELRNTRDHVPVEALPEFLKQLDQVHDDAYFTLTDRDAARHALVKSDAPPEGPSLDFAMAVVMGLALGAWAGWFFWNFNPRTRPAQHGGYRPGLEGWLVLVTLGVLLNPLYLMAALFEWSQVIGMQAGFDEFGNGVKFLLLMQVLGDCVLLVGAWVLPVLLYRHRSSFPLAYITTGILGVVLTGLGYLTAVLRSDLTESEVGAQLLVLIAAAVGAGAWIAYMRLSQRVRVTFVRDSKGGYPMPQSVAASA